MNSSFNNYCNNVIQSPVNNNDVIGYRSPSLYGHTSPGQGRSVREIEEQMTALRKENFNLKLRIYFLEEKVPGYNSSNNQQDGHEISMLKQNVDLKVDNEVLRKELQEKQAILCEAATAIDLMEQQEKTIKEQNQAIIDELNEKIRYLEAEVEKSNGLKENNTIDQLMGRTELGNDVDNIQKIRELDGLINQYKENFDEQKTKISEMEVKINEKEAIISDLEKKLKQLDYQNAELQEQFDLKTEEIKNYERKNKILTNDYKNVLLEKSTIENEKIQLKSEIKKLTSNIEQLQSDLDNQKYNLKEKIHENETQAKSLQKLQSTILNRLKSETKLSATLEDYEKIIKNLRNDNVLLNRQNTDLITIIFQMEDFIKYDRSNLEIRLGSPSRNQQTSSSLQKSSKAPTSNLNRKTNKHFLSSLSNNFPDNYNYSKGIISNPFLTSNLNSKTNKHFLSSLSDSFPDNYNYSKGIISNPILVNPLFAANDKIEDMKFNNNHSNQNQNIPDELQQLFLRSSEQNHEKNNGEKLIRKRYNKNINSDENGKSNFNSPKNSSRNKNSNFHIKEFKETKKFQECYTLTKTTTTSRTTNCCNYSSSRGNEDVYYNAPGIGASANFNSYTSHYHYYRGNNKTKQFNEKNLNNNSCKASSKLCRSSSDTMLSCHSELSAYSPTISHFSDDMNLNDYHLIEDRNNNNKNINIKFDSKIKNYNNLQQQLRHQQKRQQEQQNHMCKKSHNQTAMCKNKDSLRKITKCKHDGCCNKANSIKPDTKSSTKSSNSNSNSNIGNFIEKSFLSVCNKFKKNKN